jgi:hypothetical protein
MNTTESNETFAVDGVVDAAAAAAVADPENVAVVVPPVVAEAVASTVAGTSDEEENVGVLVDSTDDEEEEFSKGQIRDWTKYYQKDDKQLRAYVLEKYPSTTDAALKKIRKSTAETLTKILFIKDKEVAFQNLYNNLFRWQVRIRYNLPVPGVAVAPAYLEEPLIGDKEYRYYLQLKINDVWRDWVYIDKSKTGHDEYGLFAADNFPKGTIIGCYVGPNHWTSEVIGGSMPSSQKLKKANVPVSNPLTLLTYRDNKARMVTVVPSRFSSDVTESVFLYMGMQFINYVGDSHQPNTLLIDDGSVEATKDISADTELLTIFKSVETDDEEQQEKKQPAKRKRRYSKKKNK